VYRKDFQVGSNSLNCGPIVYSLVSLGKPPFTLLSSATPGKMTIETQATLLSQVKLYNYYIKGCIHFASDNYDLCGRSKDLQIEIKDPCLTTVPSTEAITTI